MDGVLVGEQVDDVKSVLDDLHGQDLLSIVTTVNHHCVDNTLNNWAHGFVEALLVVLASCVWDEGLVLGLLLDGNVVLIVGEW